MRSTNYSSLSAGDENMQPERNELSMSYMMIATNQYGTVLTADTLLCVEEKYTFYTVNEFQKVFYVLDNTPLIWGYIGNYGYEEEYLKHITKLMNQENVNIYSKIMEVKSCLEEIGSKHEDSLINLFISFKTDNNLVNIFIDLYNGEVKEGMISDARFAGNLLYMNNYFGNNFEIEKYTKEEMIQRSFEVVQRTIDIDSYIHEKNPRHRQTVGGDVISLFLGVDGEIEIYRNGEIT